MRATLTRPDGHAGVTDYHHDGLHRLRQIIDYLDWPYSDTADVTTYAYDDQGNRLAFKSLQ